MEGSEDTDTGLPRLLLHSGWARTAIGIVLSLFVALWFQRVHSKENKQRDDGSQPNKLTASTTPVVEEAPSVNDGSDSNTNRWRCACETGFLPPALLKNLGGAEAVLRMGVGQCYHKKNY